MPEGSLQSIVSWMTTSGARAGIFVKDDGTLAALINVEKIGELCIGTEEKFHSNRWYFIAVTFDSEEKELLFIAESSVGDTSELELSTSRRLDSGIDGPQNRAIDRCKSKSCWKNGESFQGKDRATITIWSDSIPGGN